ncbi:MAG: substrate-binding domain-containing protein [Lachnospiraceae bacterium]|nr:substrate-binding domain-containing protein [Lachnospiraceae bacterium]
MKNKYLRFLFVLFFAAAVFSLLYLSFFLPQLPKATEQYSVILYQYTDNDWTSLLEGIRQAEEDEGVVVNYVTTSLEASPENELELVKREIENGAEGILLAPADSDILAKEIAQIAKNTPVITLETGLGTENADISGDNYGMGYLLGCQVADDMQRADEKSVCIIKEYMERQSVQQRCQGFVDAIGEKLPEALIQEYSRSEGDYNLPVCIANMYLHGSSGIYIAALDKYCTEALIEAVSSSESEPNNYLFRQRAYGIGNTEKTVSGLDAGLIRGLVYQNEFNMGYQGLQALIQKKQNKKTEPNAEIKYYYVTQDTLYEPENQRLLFPLK